MVWGRASAGLAVPACRMWPRLAQQGVHFAPNLEHSQLSSIQRIPARRELCTSETATRQHRVTMNDEYRRERLRRMSELEAAGEVAYPHAFHVDTTASQIVRR